MPAHSQGNLFQTVYSALIRLLLIACAVSTVNATEDTRELFFADQTGAPLPWVVLRYRGDDLAVPAGSETPSVSPSPFIIDQRNKQFTPFVSIVPVGATIRFPNSDDVRHHVYSFSEGNAFERKLYRADDAQPVAFPTPGLVAMGCNIHDNMQAYVLVTDQPAWISDDAGRITLPAALPLHAMEHWHPLLNGQGTFAPLRPTAINADTVALSLTWVDPQAPRTQGDLEELLRRFSVETP